MVGLGKPLRIAPFIFIVQDIESRAAYRRFQAIIDAGVLVCGFTLDLVTRELARSQHVSLLPKCRQPVGQDLMQAGSSPAPTRSEHSVHL